MKKLIVLLFGVLLLSSCEEWRAKDAESSSGVAKASIVVQTDPNGFTVEQRNIAERYKRDNTPGSIKHLYVISAYSGQVIIYSTVQGKVTSASKRLNPSTTTSKGESTDFNTFAFMVAGKAHYTNEVLGDDGSYGSSDPYIYWFDTKGGYHQHYITGGQVIHISDMPLAVKSIIINMELGN